MSINVVIDIYHGDVVSSFETVKAAGVEGVIHKAGTGVDAPDSAYASRKPEALAAGLMWGAYHFGTGAHPGKDQAESFLSIVNPGPTDLLALDFEDNPSGPTMTLEQAVDFVETVYNEVGRYPGFYSGSLIKELLGNDTNATLAKCWLWLPEYGPTAHVPASWSDWTLWQYTGDGLGNPPHTVDGIQGNVDRNQFRGNLADLRKFWGYGATGAKSSQKQTKTPVEKPAATEDPKGTGVLTVEDFSSGNDLTQIDSAGAWPIYKVDNTEVIAVKAKMDIDADGSPHAYEPNNQGLDINQDAKDGNEWVGVATDSHGNPVVQGANDPAPGYYVSTTSLEDPTQPVDSPSRYVDSEAVSYIVIPHSHNSVGWELGDLATVIRLRDGKHVHAIVGDIGPRSKFGEASVAAAKALDVNPSARIGGDQDNDFGYLIYKGSAASPPWPRTNEDIASSAEVLFDATASESMIDGLAKAPASVVRPTPPPADPLIVFSATEAGPLGEGLQKFLNQFPGDALPISGKPDAATSSRLREVLGISLKGAPDGSSGTTSSAASSFVIYDPHNRTDYGEMLEDYLNTFDGVDLASDGYPGHDASTALHTVFGSYLPGDPDSGDTSATPLIPFDPHHYSQYALRLQTALNGFPGVQLTEDGYPGGTTSDATLEILGSRLRYDPKA